MSGVADEKLRAALSDANIPTLLMVVVHLTGDFRWLQPPYRPTRTQAMDDNTDGGLPSDVQEEIRDAAFHGLVAWRDGAPLKLAEPSTDQLVEMMSACMGEPVSAEYVPMMLEEMGLRERDAVWLDRLDPAEVSAEVDRFRVLIIGAGFAGICAAIKLDRAGIPYTVIEKNHGIGGTWLDNSYPGCRVDTPSHLYSYSFAPNPAWSSYYALRDEKLDYLRRCAESTGVAGKTRFGTEVRSATYDTETGLWTVRVGSDDGGPDEYVVNVVISAVGQLNRPQIPNIPGLAEFEGQAFHSAQWNHEVDINGQRVAVVGTGASAMQIVPAIAAQTSHLTVFQRSPQWAAPNEIYRTKVPEGKKVLLGAAPFYGAWYRFRALWTFNDKIYYALQIDPEWTHPERSINAANDRHREFLTNYIKSQVNHDEELVAKTLPTYPPFGKRMLLDNGWFKTMTRDNVELVTSPIREIRAHSIVTEDGTEHPVDTIVFATGFQAKHFLWPMEIRGSQGRTLRETWGEDDATAHLGICVPGFPGLFCLYGPNTNLAHGGSVIFHIECQVRYVMGLIADLLKRRTTTVDVHRDVYEDYVARVDAAHDRMIWSHRGMDVWYRNKKGRVVNNSPWRLVDYWAMTRVPDPAEYDWIERPVDAGSSNAAAGA